VAKGNNVTPIATSSETAAAAVRVQAAPTGLAIAPDGATLWVVCSGPGTLEPVNLSAQAITPEPDGVVSVPGGPYAIALVAKQHSLATRLLGAAAAKAKKTS